MKTGLHNNRVTIVRLHCRAELYRVELDAMGEIIITMLIKWYRWKLQLIHETDKLKNTAVKKKKKV